MIFQLQLLRHINNAKSFLNDKSELGAIRTTVQMVRHNQTVVAPNRAPSSHIFSDHQTIVPYEVRIEKELVKFMNQRSIRYLLVF